MLGSEAFQNLQKKGFTLSNCIRCPLPLCSLSLSLSLSLPPTHTRMEREKERVAERGSSERVKQKTERLFVEDQCPCPCSRLQLLQRR